MLMFAGAVQLDSQTTRISSKMLVMIMDKSTGAVVANIVRNRDSIAEWLDSHRETYPSSRFRTLLCTISMAFEVFDSVKMDKDKLAGNLEDILPTGGHA
jgi:hypothetical protein